MLVEIAGIDGSGKSTLIDRITGWVHRCGGVTYEWNIRSYTRRMIGTTSELSRTLAGDPLELAVCAELIKESNAGMMLRSPGQLLLADNYTRNWLANAAENGITILEEIAALYRRFVPAPELCLEVEVDSSIAYQRILNRTKLDPSIQSGGIEYLDRRAQAFRQTRSSSGYAADIVRGELSQEEMFKHARALILSRAEIADPELLLTLRRV